MSNLINLETVELISDLKGLHALYDEVETQVHSLDNLGLQLNHYGPMLIPVLMKKLLEGFKVNILREFDKNVWGISKFLKIFKCELTTQEKVTTKRDWGPQSDVPY